MELKTNTSTDREMRSKVLELCRKFAVDINEVCGLPLDGGANVRVNLMNPPLAIFPYLTEYSDGVFYSFKNTKLFTLRITQVSHHNKFIQKYGTIGTNTTVDLSSTIKQNHNGKF